MAQLNYRHLRYFWAIAHAGSLARAADQLNVSHSALSTQVRQLEARLGHELFDRSNRRLELTEAGRIALEFADSIFKAGDELMRTLEGADAGRQHLRVGAVATLSRNFQSQLIAPLLRVAEVELVLRTGTFSELLAQLESHALDVVLSNLPVPHELHSLTRSRLVAEQEVSLVARHRPAGRDNHFRFPADLAGVPLILPGWQNNIRAGFELLLEQAGIRPLVVAEVDDMPMMRLLAREGVGTALVPPVVVYDELRQGVLHELCRVPSLKESFFAITRGRKFPNPLVAKLLGEPQAEPGADPSPPSTGQP